ncbi:GNAT family N-acetyltransferase [Streptomyces sp. NPDC047108]|uniref:GNAT family N-acetyltransferase n=1 Tax=Streptomyces sp. NPDC047108 TaxID=3155025 RepID=UPI0033D825CC
MEQRITAARGLWLRRWTDGDAGPVLTAFSDPSMRWQSSAPVSTPDAAARWIADRNEQWASGSAFSFAVTDDTDTVLGQVAVGAVNRQHRTGWVSYWTTEQARGRGVASQACRSLARWVFAEAALFRLELGHRTNNPASCRVAVAAGFAVEGTERRKLEYDGVRYDVERHARLATDEEPAPLPPVRAPQRPAPL